MVKQGMYYLQCVAWSSTHSLAASRRHLRAGLHYSLPLKQRRCTDGDQGAAAGSEWFVRGSMEYSLYWLAYVLLVSGLFALVSSLSFHSASILEELHFLSYHTSPHLLLLVTPFSRCFSTSPSVQSSPLTRLSSAFSAPLLSFSR